MGLSFLTTKYGEVLRTISGNFAYIQSSVMNTREKLLSLTIVLLVAMNAYDARRADELREQVHQQKIELLKACIADYGVRNCNY